MDQIALGKKLKILREENFLTQDAVEKAIGLPQKALTHIESGSRRISTLELAKLAELFRISIKEFFIEQKIDEEDLRVALYRAIPGLKVNNEIAECIQICREGVLLEKLLDLSRGYTILAYPLSIPKNTKESIDQGETIAHHERCRLELGDRPIYDIIELFSSQGIWTAGADLPKDISGLFLQDPSLGMAILVNTDHVYSRQRFSYAHEYAHALFDQKRTLIVSKNSNASELIEVRANAFASAFLMPEAGVSNLLRLMGKGGSSRSSRAVFDIAENIIEAKSRQFAANQKISLQVVALVAHHFGVSYQAALYRLQNLNYLKRGEKDELLNQEVKGKEYLRILNFKDLDMEKRKTESRTLKAYVAYLAIEAYQRKEISRGRLLELSKLLQLSGESILNLAENGKE